jgi:hypothetical protein
MYRSGLVPPRMASLGLIGGPVSVVGAIFVLFGAWEQTSSIQGILTLGEIAWEASLGIYLIVKGFRPSPILDDARFTGGSWAPCALRLRRRRSYGSSAARDEHEQRTARDAGRRCRCSFDERSSSPAGTSRLLGTSSRSERRIGRRFRFRLAPRALPLLVQGDSLALARLAGALRRHVQPRGGRAGARSGARWRPGHGGAAQRGARACRHVRYSAVVDRSISIP